VEAALADREYVADYLHQVDESKRLLYAACDRLGLRYWPSAANFVLVQAGARVAAVIEGAERLGIYLRDRSGEPGCAGCLRISTGVVEHTRRCIDVLEEVLCAAR
jgi:histidinol-phosphate aminotransferase